MAFARAIWKLLVGIKDVFVLVFMMLFFGLLYFLLSARPAPVGEGVLALDLDGVVVEQPTRAAVSELIAGSARVREHRLYDLVLALREAKTDSRVKAVALDLENFLGGGQTSVATLAEALREVRAAGKPVIAYSVGYTDDSYQLAASASEVWLNPLGMVLVAGPGGQNLYYRGLLEKLGVTANVYRVGTYKAAVEPFTRDDMSPEAEQNALALGQALLQTWVDDVASARPKARVAEYVRNPVGAAVASRGDLARAALNAGLVDRLADRSAFEQRLARISGADPAGLHGYRRIRLQSYLNDVLPAEAGGNVGVVTVAGTIVDGRAGPGTAGGESIAEAIERGLRQRNLRALVVRVDSPGGSVLASERIRQAILQAKAKGMPVVVSMGNVAASGGYWVSTPANFIFAEPSTVTGSIGVFGILPSFEGSLQKLGLGADGIKTTPLSGEPDLLNGPSPEADRLIQASIESIYGRFLGIVAQSRRKTPAEIDRIAQGRVWDGGTARQIGLVDGFGGLEEAVAKAAELAKLERDDVQLTFLERPTTLRDSVVELLAQPDEGEAGPTDAYQLIGGAPEAALRQALADARAILFGPRIQARCLACPPATEARAPADESSWLAALVKLFS
jgi:protease IV